MIYPSHARQFVSMFKILYQLNSGLVQVLIVDLNSSNNEDPNTIISIIKIRKNNLINKENYKCSKNYKCFLEIY